MLPLLALLVVAGPGGRAAALNTTPTPQPMMLATHLGFVLPPDNKLVAGVCTELTLAVLDANRNPTSLASALDVVLGRAHSVTPSVGAFYDSATCGTTITAVRIESTQSSKKLWYREKVAGDTSLVATHTAADSSLQLGVATAVVTVRAAQASSFILTWQRSGPVPAGEAVVLTVQPVDEFGNIAFDYGGQVQFTSTDPRALLPQNATFGSGNGVSQSFGITFGTVGAWSVTVSDTSGAFMTKASGPLQVEAAAYHTVTLTRDPSGTLSACAPVKLKLQAVDLYGNPMAKGIRVTVCGSGGTPVSSPGPCVEVDLAPDTGAAVVEWKSDTAQTLEFIATDSATLVGPVAVTWGAPAFDATKSTVAFSGTTEAIPELRVFTGLLGLYFEPRDSCGAPTALPADKPLTFESSSPLLFFSEPERQADERWKVYLVLKSCDGSITETLGLRPLLAGQPVSGLERKVKPLCLPADAQLTVSAEPQGLKAAPGQPVEFVVEVRNAGQQAFLPGQLGFDAQGMTELSLDGQDFTLGQGAHELPRLPPGAVLTVKGLARADVSPDSPVRIQLWYSSAWGVRMTEKVLLDFEREKLGVDVGAGCGAGPASGPALGLALLLLAAASRSRGPSRRLGRGERAGR